MKKLVFSSILTLLTGCSVSVVWAPKSVSVEDSRNVDLESQISGSDLKDFNASQKSDGKFSAKGIPSF